jgi:hypothetical protein
MNASVLLAFAGVLLFAAIGLVLAWMAGSALEQNRQEQIAAALPRPDRPDAMVSPLVGSLDAAPGVPHDLAARHDDYLY